VLHSHRGQRGVRLIGTHRLVSYHVGDQFFDLLEVPADVVFGQDCVRVVGHLLFADGGFEADFFELFEESVHISLDVVVFVEGRCELATGGFDLVGDDCLASCHLDYLLLEIGFLHGGHFFVRDDLIVQL